MKVIIRPKIYVILWLITHGFLPQRYFWARKFNIGHTTHNRFSYKKMLLCGYIVYGEHISKNLWLVNKVWDFPDALVRRIEE